MSKTLYTESEINAANTSQLQEMYKNLTGKPTTDRNKGKLMARVLRLNAEAKAKEKPAAKKAGKKPAAEVPQSPFAKDDKKPADKDEKVERKAKIKASAEKAKPAAPASSPEPVKSAVKDPFAKMRATGKPAAPKATPNPATAGERAKAKPAATGRTRSDSETCKILSALPPGTVLEHNFRGGESVRVTVVKPPDANGKGGDYRYKNKKYDDLRAAVLDASGIPWNVLMFFRRTDTGELLKPYPKHRKVERAEATA